MVASSAQGAHRFDPGGRWGRRLLVFPTVCAVFNIAVQLYLTSAGMFDSTYWQGMSAWAVLESIALSAFNNLGLMAYSLAAPLALTVLIFVGQRRFPRAMAVVTAACVAFTAATFGLLISMLVDESSTAVLLLLFLPTYLVIMLIPFALVTVVVHRLRTRSANRRQVRGSSVRPRW